MKIILLWKNLDFQCYRNCYVFIYNKMSIYYCIESNLYITLSDISCYHVHHLNCVDTM